MDLCGYNTSMHMMLIHIATLLQMVMYINFSVHVQGQEFRGQNGSALTEKGDRAPNS